MAIATKFVTMVDVVDPDSGNTVQLEVRKLASGGMVGIDSSWLEADIGPTYSPFDPGEELIIPDDEEPTHVSGQ